MLNIYNENCSVFIIYVWNLFTIHDETCEVFVMETCSVLTMKYAQKTALSSWKNFDMKEANRQRSVLIWECWKQCHAPPQNNNNHNNTHNNTSFTLLTVFSQRAFSHDLEPTDRVTPRDLKRSLLPRGSNPWNITVGKQTWIRELGYKRTIAPCGLTHKLQYGWGRSQFVLLIMMSTI